MNETRTEVVFSVPGEPQGKGRPRFGRTRDGKTVTRTPEATVLYENLIRSEYLRQCRGARFEDGAALAMRVVAFYAIPASTSKSRRLAMLEGTIRPAKKPDADNVLKVVADSLNQIAYRDDAQIVEATVEKRFSSVPGLEILLRRID